MKLNPFKETNLADLQEFVSQYLSDKASKLSANIKRLWKKFLEKGRERITIMFIPHTEKQIVNFHISIFAVSAFTAAVILTAVVTSLLIVNHTSTVQEVARLEKYGINSQIQMEKYKEEINRLYSEFQKLKPELTHLYSLVPDSDVDSLWAKGGGSGEPPEEYSEDASPMLEILNLQDMKSELTTSKTAVSQIRDFLEQRTKIIDNTPSIWPVEGYIVSRFGEMGSSYSFSRQVNNGIEIEAYPGSEIRATAPGSVTKVENDSSLGFTVTIQHKYGFSTTYSHCQRINVEVGQSVAKGERIGYVGRTGKTLNYMTLYQIKIGTAYVDPMPYLNRLAR